MISDRAEREPLVDWRVPTESVSWWSRGHDLIPRPSAHEPGVTGDCVVPAARSIRTSIAADGVTLPLE